MSDSHPTKAENWDGGVAYEAYVGRWSRVVAREFLRWLNVPLGSRWLDVGCGTGMLSQAILSQADPTEVKGVDRSASFIAFARQKFDDKRITFEVSDAQELNIEGGPYDAIVSGLVLNFIPDPAKALNEMRRLVRPGGVVAAYVWDYADEMQFMRHFWNAVIRLHPEMATVDEGRRFLLCKPAPLTTLFQEAGLNQVEVRSIDIPTPFRDFDDYWTPFLGGQGTAPTYVMSLSEGERAELREYLRERLPTNADGSIEMIARAWAVRGVRPTVDPT
jgi:SAM-dependent methyltransferase